MTFLKNLAVSLFSFLLFLSLTVFGLAFMVKSTALNADFVTAEFNRLEIASLVKEFVQIESPPGQLDLNKIINQTVSDIEPQIKEEAGSAIHSIYDYLLGKTPEPQLALTFRKTFLSTDFVTPLVNSLDVSSLAGGFISQQFAEAIPIEIPNLDKYIADALAAAEPALKKQVVAFSVPVFDYMLGITSASQATAAPEPIKQDLRNALRQFFVQSPSAELAVVPIDLRSAVFDQFYQEFARQLDETLLDSRMRTEIASGIATAEERLGQAKQYITYFQQGYTLLLVFMALLVIGIVLIVRNVKDITHRLGVPLVTYGAIEYAGIWVTKYLISSGKMRFPEIPPQLETWLLQFITDILKPLEIFSLALLVGGAVLVVLSFLYKPKKELTWS